MFASKDIFLAAPSGYTISRSVRLRSSASAYFNRTPATATNQRTWSWSVWVKRGALGTEQMLFEGGIYSGSTEQLRVFFTSTDNLEFNEFSSSAYQFRYVTTAVYRDPSAWYHILAVLDTTNSVGKLYVNGVQVTAFSTSTAPALNFQGKVNSVVAHDIGRRNGIGTYFDGYLTEINFIDGQALTPSSFGTTNAITGVWQPAKYTGTYGTNGFYLNFSDNSSNTATTIGKDYSGNGNNWTPNNISVTAGVTYDSMLDVPTMWADGGNGRGNYAVWNPLNLVQSTLSQSNLLSTASGSSTNVVSTFPTATTGKWYMEIGIYVSPNINWPMNMGASDGIGGNTYCRLYTDWSAFAIFKSVNGTTSSVTPSGSLPANGDILKIAYDADSGKLWIGLNAGWYGNTGSITGDPSTGTDATVTGISGKQIYPNHSNAGGPAQNAYLNCGQRPFTYTPPSGFVALNTQNLPDSTIKNGAAYMAATTYTGTGAALTVANTVNGTSFQPDFVWIKDRSNARSNMLQNSVTGVAQYLISDSTNAEATSSSGVTAINSNGFTVGTQLTWNGSAETYVAWQWKAGGTSSSNTNGSITSTVSVGATQGFSVVTYTGTGANATVGHGLGVAPSMIIVKNRNTAGTDWGVYHASIGATQYLLLDTTAAAASSVNFWNNTSPTSNVFSVGVGGTTNNSGSPTVAYCFSAVKGFSAFGSYTANASADGPFIYTGFRPRWIMLKRSSAAGAPWSMFDTSRNTYNSTNLELDANSSSAESTSGNGMDILSNGFKLRDSVYLNSSSGDTFIYAAFAENPFRNALAR